MSYKRFMEEVLYVAKEGASPQYVREDGKYGRHMTYLDIVDQDGNRYEVMHTEIQRALGCGCENGLTIELRLKP